MCSAASEASEASRDLQWKYQHEVLLRKKYHAQLVELKGAKGWGRVAGDGFSAGAMGGAGWAPRPTQQRPQGAWDGRSLSWVGSVQSRAWGVRQAGKG